MTGDGIVTRCAGINDSDWRSFGQRTERDQVSSMTDEADQQAWDVTHCKVCKLFQQRLHT